jgi:hypothetical protein
MVVAELAALEDRIYNREPRLRAVSHCDRHGAVQFHDRRGFHSIEDVIECSDFGPVRLRRAWRLRVDGGDGGLDAIRAESSRRQRALDERDAFRDRLAIPPGAILVLEQDQVAGG